MPFTPSHAVVALPFVRTPLVPAAIAVGAMTPDLPLFVRGLPFTYGRTHDLIWLPMTLVVALVLLLVWRCVLRPVTRELLPRPLAERLPSVWDEGAWASLKDTFSVADRSTGRRRVSLTGLVLLITSLLIGIVSHIVWDLFTHEGRWGVEAVPALAEQWGPVSGFKWLQHGSSIVGLAVIAIWSIVWLSRRTPVAIERHLPAAVRWIWIMSLPAMLVVAVWIGLLLWGPITSDFTIAHLAYRVLPPACAVWGVVTLVLAVTLQLIRARAGSRSDASGVARRDRS